VIHECPTCQRVLGNAANLKRHARVCTVPKCPPTGQPVIHECPTCQLVVANAANLKRHARVCTGPRPDRPATYTCTRCEYCTPRRDTYERHTATCTVIKYRCPLDIKCKDYRFPERSWLAAHMRGAHGMTYEAADAAVAEVVHQ